MAREPRPAGTKPGRGYGSFAFRAGNQDGEIVMTFTCTLIPRRRPNSQRGSA